MLVSVSVPVPGPVLAACDAKMRRWTLLIQTTELLMMFSSAGDVMAVPEPYLSHT